MTIAVRLVDVDVDPDDGVLDAGVLAEHLVDDTDLQAAARGGEYTVTVPHKVRTPGGVAQVVVTVRCYKPIEVTA